MAAGKPCSQFTAPPKPWPDQRRRPRPRPRPRPRRHSSHHNSRSSVHHSATHTPRVINANTTQPIHGPAPHSLAPCRQNAGTRQICWGGQKPANHSHACRHARTHARTHTNTHTHAHTTYKRTARREELGVARFAVQLLVAAFAERDGCHTCLAPALKKQTGLCTHLSQARGAAWRDGRSREGQAQGHHTFCQNSFLGGKRQSQ